MQEYLFHDTAISRNYTAINVLNRMLQADLDTLYYQGLRK